MTANKCRHTAIVGSNTSVKNMKPALAEDAILEKLKLPVIGQPKIDGVRALTQNAKLVGRSLKAFAAPFMGEYFSRPELDNLDGEMTLGDQPNSTNRLCHATTGALGRVKGVTTMDDFHWWVFDDLTDPTLPYLERFRKAAARTEALNDQRVHLVPHTLILYTMDEVREFIAWCYDNGFEGAMFKNMEAPHKEGRATQTGQQMWRVKPWMDSEMLVTGFTEGETNLNQATTNALGRTERSSAKAGKVPNGTVGAIHGTVLQDIHCPMTGNLLFRSGLPITIGPGEMTEAEAKHYFEHSDELVAHIAKFKHMTHGIKDLPRMATFISLRLKEDMG